MDDLGETPVSDDGNETEYFGDDGIDPAKIPFKFMDIHHQAVDLVIKPCMKRKILPESGITVITFDAHINDIVPEDMQLRLLANPSFIKNRIFQQTGIHSWITSLAEEGYLNHVIWIKPPWTTGVKDGSRIVEVNNLENNVSHEVSLDIKTFCRSIFEDADDDYDGLQSLFSNYLNCQTPYILDLTLSFFSSDNYFTKEYSQSSACYTLLKELFKIPEFDSTDPEDIKQVQEEREKNLKELEYIFNHLEKSRSLPPIEDISEINYEKVSEIREELLKVYPEEEIQWFWLIESGLVINDYQLPVHKTERADIEKMVNECVSRIVDSLPHSPTAIIVAIELDFEDLTSKEDVDFIIDLLKEMFKNKFENLDNPHFVGYG